MHRALRNKRPLSVVMADIDHFKLFNDRYGHDAGDEVLTTVADVLRHCVRSEDVASRYGGEEFMFVMLDAAMNDAVARCEALREEVQALEVMHVGRRLDPLTLSLGVAVFPQHGTTWRPS